MRNHVIPETYKWAYSVTILIFTKNDVCISIKNDLSVIQMLSGWTTAFHSAVNLATTVSTKLNWAALLSRSSEDFQINQMKNPVENEKSFTL